MPYKPKVCAVCGKTFEPTSGRAKYCVLCGQEQDLKRKRLHGRLESAKKKNRLWHEQHHEKKLQASREYRQRNPEKGRQSQMAWRQKQREKRPARTKQACLECGELFQPRDTRSRFCGKMCRRKYNAGLFYMRHMDRCKGWAKRYAKAARRAGRIRKRVVSPEKAREYNRRYQEKHPGKVKETRKRAKALAKSNAEFAILTTFCEKKGIL